MAIYPPGYGKICRGNEPFVSRNKKTVNQVASTGKGRERFFFSQVLISLMCESNSNKLDCQGKPHVPVHLRNNCFRDVADTCYLMVNIQDHRETVN